MKEAIYTSKCTAKSLWQEYRIFEDRIELDSLFGMISIGFDQIEKASLSESEIKGLLKGDLHVKDFRPAIKLDWANFKKHIVIDKSSGNVGRVLFTPDDPQAFMKVLSDAIEKHNKKNC